MKRLLRPTRLLVLAGLSTVALVVFFGYTCRNPPDRVHIFVANIPPGTDFLSLAALRGGRLHSMVWSPKHIFGPFPMHPANCVWSYLNHPENAKVDYEAFVYWEQGERYGVVTRTTKGDWRITWLDPPHAPHVWLIPLLGGGETSFDLSVGVTEPLSGDQLRELGLDKVENMP